MSMGIIRLIRPGLFFYECIRIIILAAFAIPQPGDPALLPRLVFAAPSALFPLMALFLWLDIQRYRAYLPLFAAGKCISIIALLGWSIVSRRFTMVEEFSGANVSEWMLLSGDLLAMAAILLIIRDERKSDTEVN